MPANSTPDPRPGRPPSVVAVAKFLRAAGFQISRYTESHSQAKPGGAKVTTGLVAPVRVTYTESDYDFFRRMTKGGYTDVTDVPAAPDTEARLQAYAEALQARYAVAYSHSSLHLSALPWLPTRPAGVPSAATVRKAFEAARLHLLDLYFGNVTVVKLPDHTRVAVKDGDILDEVLNELDAQGWIYERSENIEHYVIKIIGATPDRPARLAALKAQRAQQQPAPAIADEEEEPAAEETTQEPQTPPAPTAPPETAPAPPRALYGPAGQRYAPGVRVTFRTADGFLISGKIESIAPADADRQTVTFLADRRAIAPPSRPIKGTSPHSIRYRAIAPPEPWTVDADARNLTPEK